MTGQARRLVQIEVVEDEAGLKLTTGHATYRVNSTAGGVLNLSLVDFSDGYDGRIALGLVSSNTVTIKPNMPGQ